jgi:hypothetical protein
MTESHFGQSPHSIYARGRLGAGLALDSIASDWFTALRQEQERRGCERHHRICFSRLLVTLHRAGVTLGGYYRTHRQTQCWEQRRCLWHARRLELVITREDCMHG